MAESENAESTRPDAETTGKDPLVTLEEVSAEGPSRDARLLTAYLHERHVACPKCGYDLCNCQTGACPECGELVKMQIERVRPAVTNTWVTTVVFLAMGTGLGLPVLLLVVLSGGRVFDAGVFTCSMLVYIVCIPLLFVTIAKREAFTRSPDDHQVAWATITGLVVGISILIMLGMMLGFGRW